MVIKLLTFLCFLSVKEQHVLDANAEKQMSQATTDV